MPHEPQQTGQESGAIAAPEPYVVAAFEPAPGRLLADDQLVVLHEVAKSLALDRSLQATLSLIADKACFLTSSASTALCLLDEDRETLDFAAVAGRGAAEMVGQRVRVEDALPGQTALSGEPLLAYSPVDEGAARGKSHPNADEDERDEPPSPIFDERFVLSGGIRSAAVVPVVIGASSVGSLAAINRLDGQSFTGSDLLMLQILASSASIGIQKDFLGRQAAQRERERNILFRVAQNTASSLDAQKILDSTLETLTYSIDISAAMVFLLNDERTHLYIAAEYGLTEEQQEIQILADSKLATTALSGDGKALIIDEPMLDPSYEEIFPRGLAQMQSMMVVPLAARNNPSGLIVVMSHQRKAYTRDDLTLLAAVSAQTAIAIENASLYEDATRRTEEATAIYELSQTVNTNLNLPRVLSFVADSILALLQVDKFALFLYNPDRQCLEIKVARNISRETVRTMCPTAERRGIAWWVYEYETPTAVQDVAADHRNRSYPIEQEGIASLVSVPLQAGDSVIGVIHAMSSRRRSFTVAEMELLYTIANQVGIAVSNIQIIEETRRKSADLRRSFRRVVRALGASADASQMAQTIVDLAADMMDVDRAVLYTIDPEAGTLQPILHSAKGLRLPVEAFGTVAAPPPGVKETSAAWVARRGRPLALKTPAQDPQFTPSPLLAPYVTRCGFYLGVPLKIGKEVVGVLEMYAREAKTIQADEMRQYLTFAAQSAVALQNSLLVEDAARRKRDVEVIAQITRELRNAEVIDTRVLSRCLSQLVEVVGADYALLGGTQKLGIKRKGLLVGRGGEIGNGSGSGDDQPIRDTLRQVLESMRQRKSVELVWPDSPGDVWPVKGVDPRPCAVYALMDKGQSGGLCVARRPGRVPLRADDLRLIQIVAKLIGIFA